MIIIILVRPSCVEPKFCSIYVRDPSFRQVHSVVQLNGADDTANDFAPISLYGNQISRDWMIVDKEKYKGLHDEPESEQESYS